MTFKFKFSTIDNIQLNFINNYGYIEQVMKCSFLD